MEKFSQLSYYERDKIYRWLCSRKAMGRIAEELGRDKSTISREIKRNSDRIGYLYPGVAHEYAQQRKNKNKSKISKDQELKEYVLQGLNKRWSPNVIAGRYKLENQGKSTSREAIYQWIYSPEGEALQLKKLLVRAHKKRGLKRRAKKTNIKNRISIHQRPDNINRRDEAGHFECDLIFNSGSQSKNICTLTDRLTRESILIKNECKSTKTVIDAVILHITRNKLGVKSITFDNGSEFTGHEKLNQLGMQTYFCDPGCPWQKGSVEHLNGMLRRYLPFSMSAEAITPDYVESVNMEINNMPRAILGFKTPLESRVKLAQPATEACDNMKLFGVAFHS